MTEMQNRLNKWNFKRQHNDSYATFVTGDFSQSQLYLVQIALEDLFEKVENDPDTCVNQMLNYIDILIDFCRKKESFIFQS